MNLTLRARIFIVISIVVLIILAISITLVVVFKQNNTTEEGALGENQNVDQQTQNNNQNFNTSIQPTVVSQDLVLKPQTTEEKMRLASENIAKIFIERYGSYSTDNPGQNLKDLQVLCSVDLWNVLKKKIDSMVASKEFTGVTTRAFSSSIVSYENDKSIVNIISIRQENKENVLREYNQEAEVTLVRNGNSWLVDDIKWK